MEIMVSIKSKADALVFAVNKVCENGNSFDKGKIDEIYDYITSKVNLPDVEVDVRNEYMNAIGGMLERYASMLDGISSETRS